MSLDSLPATCAQGAYEFRRASRADAHIVRQWLDAEHVGEWWTPAEEELSAALSGETGLNAYIVSYQGWPFAYLQIADPAFDPVLSEQVDFPKGTLRLDQFIGDTNMIGFGHGINFIKAFIKCLKDIPDIRRLIVLPMKSNVFAARSYSQCGFRSERTLELETGPMVLMGQNLT